MDISIATGFQREFPAVMAKIAEELSSHLDQPVELDSESLDLRRIPELYEESGDGVVCGRAVFVRKTNGIGGLLIPEAVALAWSGIETSGEDDSPSQPLPLSCAHRESLSETFSMFVSAWNNAAPPDFRFEATMEEQSVEIYPTSVPMPETAGVFPCALRYGFTLPNGVESYLAILIPTKAVQGREVASFVPPEEFVPYCMPGEATLGAGAPNGSDAPSSAASMKVDPNRPHQPVVFVDYTGEVLPWLLAHAKKPGRKLLLNDSFSAAGSPEGSPAATILVGVDPARLGDLEAKVVEIVPE